MHRKQQYFIFRLVTEKNKKKSKMNKIKRLKKHFIQKQIYSIINFNIPVLNVRLMPNKIVKLSLHCLKVQMTS